MITPYHPGELRVQGRIGSEETAKTMARTIYPVIAHQFVDFIRNQPMVVCASVDTDGMVWASLLSGQPGFMEVVDEQALRINALPDMEDPLSGAGDELGLIIIDFSTRRRLRLNGRAHADQEGISVHPRQVYANCPRYIQTREYAEPAAAAPAPTHGTALSATQRQLIGRADTFFLASFHPQGGADCSHRGGFPGFAQPVDEKNLIWPDYNGNGMFNSLGNIAEYPNAGLLLIDFEKGSTLQLSGTASILWEDERIFGFPGAERLVEFKISKVIETGHATSLRWRFVDYSADNPWWG
jgi:predicted pyridoxine 5'-phosphate oxidase superfamily flavin-nucleotide-binding protein